METRAPLVLSGLLIGGMLAVSAWAWPALAENARIAVHFDFEGNANGWMPRALALLIVPGLAALSVVLFAAAPHVSRRTEGPATGSEGYVTGWIGALMVLFVAHCAIVLKARGWQVDIPGSTSVIIALFLIAVGNVLGKTRPNRLVGVRTPWTRRSDYAWDKSNRAAGRMMVVAGFATLATLAAAGSRAAEIVLLAGIVLMSTISVYLSYHYWRTDPDRRAKRELPRQ